MAKIAKQIRLEPEQKEAIDSINAERKLSVDKEESWNKTTRMLLEIGIENFKKTSNEKL